MRFIITLLLCFYCAVLVAQSPNYNVSFPSPNAASLGLYGEVPVSLHSGIADIAIPMYEINEGPIKLPISLSYHASGVRPDVHPGWVGNGWTLNCGGMITRITKGAPDETAWQQDLTINAGGNNKGSRAYWVGSFFNNLLQDAGWATPSRIDFLAKRGTDYGDNSDYYKETEPDEFVFNFNGISGKFVFDENHQPRVLEHPEIKVELEDTNMIVGYVSTYVKDNNGRVIDSFTYARNPMLGNLSGWAYEKEIKLRGFKITMPDGIEYEFGCWNMGQLYENSPMEASIDFFQQVYCNESWDTWYLKRIKAPTGHTIDLVYGPDADNLHRPIASFGRTFAIEKSSGTAPAKGIFRIFGPVSASSTSIKEYYTGRIIYPAYVTKIITSKEIIDLSTSNTKELSYDYYVGIQNSLLDQANAYDPAVSGYLSARNNIIYGGYIHPELLQWKKLDNLIIKNKETGEIVKQWNFNYTNDLTKRLTLLNVSEQGKPGTFARKWEFKYDESPLPLYNSYQTDHWGFYNNTLPNLGDLTDADLAGFYNSRNANPAPNVAQAGILKKVIYPTGGYTDFEYESNMYDAIVKRDNNNGNFSLQPVFTTYAGGLRIKSIKSYVQPGVLGSSKTYTYSGGILSGDAQYFWKGYAGKLLNGNTYTADRFVTQTMLPVSTNSVGCHIGYSKVTEYVTGNGRTEYYYRNYDILDENFLATIDVQKSKFSPFSSHDFERGQLTKSIVYNEAGAMLQTEEYKYPTAGTSYIRATSTKQVPVLGGYAVEGSSYKIYTDPFQSNQTVSTQHSQRDDTKTLTTTTDYVYDPTYGLLKELHTNNSKKEPKVTTYKYPFDMVPGNDPQGVYNAMKQRNILMPVIEQAVTINNQFIQSTKTNYKDWGSSILAPESVEMKEKNSPNAEVRLRYMAYDDRGNVLSVAKEKDVRKAYVWGYNKNYPEAEVVNANENEVYFSSFEAQGGWDGNLTVTDNRAHTGRKTGYIYKPDPGEKTAHSLTTLPVSLTSVTKYKYSGWLYSDGPSAEIFLFMKRAGETSYFTYVDAIGTFETNKWVLLEKEFDVPADVTQMNIRVDNNGGGSVWFDDIRLHPAAAQMKTYTYDPLAGMTSKTDENNRVTYFEYDDYARLHIVRDDQSNIIRKICYNYAGQPEDCLKAFGNDAMSKTFTRTSCDYTYIGGQMDYKVDAGIYVSFISKADANQQALNDINTNGQNWVNQNGPCTRTVYARLEGQRPVDVIVEEEPRERQLMESRADLYIHFYADAACTQAITVSGFSLQVHLDPDAFRYGGGGTEWITVPCNNYMVKVADNVAMNRVDSWWNPDIQWWSTLATQTLHHSITPSPDVVIK